MKIQKKQLLRSISIVCIAVIILVLIFGFRDSQPYKNGVLENMLDSFIDIDTSLNDKKKLVLISHMKPIPEGAPISIASAFMVTVVKSPNLYCSTYRKTRICYELLDKEGTRIAFDKRKIIENHLNWEKYYPQDNDNYLKDKLRGPGYCNTYQMTFYFKINQNCIDEESIQLYGIPKDVLERVELCKR